MTIYNLGSINLDHLYQVDHLVRPGETLTSTDYQIVLGGKGANQSIALARAGAKVCHIGAIGRSDDWALTLMAEAGVDTSAVSQLEGASGHAIIQLDRAAENAIILYPGANHRLSTDDLASALKTGQAEDWLLLQHETNALSEAIDIAQPKGMKVAYNPAPMVTSEARALIDRVDLLIVNEVEAMDLTDTKTPADAEDALQEHYPELRILLTLGKAGVIYLGPEGRLHQPAFVVEAIDTTGAGDTFIGFSLAALTAGANPSQAMRRGAAASALCVTRLGASTSIPSAAEVNQFLKQQE